MSHGIQKPAIDIGIITNNLDAMLEFYRDTLGLELEAVIDMPGGGVMNRFKVGESIVKVIETEPKPEVSAPPGGIRGATGYRYWTLHVNDLAAAVSAVTAAGHKVVVVTNNPYIIGATEEADTVVCNFSGTPDSIRISTDLLFGKIKPYTTTKMPVDLSNQKKAPTRKLRARKQNPFGMSGS